MQLFLQVTALLVVVFNLWIAGRISPVVQDIALIDSRVAALEKTIDERAIVVERFIQLEQRDAILVTDMEQLKKDMRELLIIHQAGSPVTGR